MLGNRHLTGFAHVGRRVRVVAIFATFPAQLLKAQPLPVPAVRTRHEVAPLVGGFVFPFDGADAGNRRRRHNEDLAPGKCPGTGLGQRHRIALAIDVDRITIDLVEEEIPHRHRTQADRAVRASHHQHATAKLLGQNRIAGVAAPGRRDQLTQDRRFINQRINALLRVALGHFDGGPDRHHGTGGVVNHVADPVRSHLGRTELGRLHEYHPFDRRGRRQAIHDLFQIRRAAGAPPPRFRRGFRGQHAMPVGPLRHRQQRIRDEPLPPGTFDVERAFVLFQFHQSTRARSSPSSIR